MLSKGLAARLDQSPGRVYVLVGDGEMAEGQIWEAAEFAGHYALDNLTVLADVNALGQSESTMCQHDMDIYRAKFAAEGFVGCTRRGRRESFELSAARRP